MGLFDDGSREVSPVRVVNSGEFCKSRLTRFCWWPMQSCRHSSLRLAWVVLIINLIAGQTSARAELRKIFFIVEEPTINRELPPGPQHPVDIAELSKLHELLFARLRSMNLDGYALIDGRSAIESDEPDRAKEADFAVKITISASDKGFNVEARLRDAAKDRWDGLKKTMVPPTQVMEDLRDAIAGRIFPPLLMRILEEAQPASKRVLLADCLSSSAADAALAQGVSLDYANNLTTSFSVVSLINNLDSELYNWWCLKLPPPRFEVHRKDTQTIYGRIVRLKDAPVILGVELHRVAPSKSFPTELIELELDSTHPVAAVKEAIRKRLGD